MNLGDHVRYLENEVEQLKVEIAHREKRFLRKQQSAKELLNSGMELPEKYQLLKKKYLENDVPFVLDDCTFLNLDNLIKYLQNYQNILLAKQQYEQCKFLATLLEIPFNERLSFDDETDFDKIHSIYSNLFKDFQHQASEIKSLCNSISLMWDTLDIEEAQREPLPIIEADFSKSRLKQLQTTFQDLKEKERAKFEEILHCKVAEFFDLLKYGIEEKERFFCSIEKEEFELVKRKAKFAAERI
ncbi:hypothetical protein ROZALSC1DRAFT_27775 [Rozella allomycis CSF55]|uniref:Uncharacterized protein n=1 Tax=Rozella allomycis (strain CSF55) TaxID=988480 RepID=A0A075AVB5_ROZAC|nr:hypothetical protein O9G_004314 [Rozella allomycis CSF55]RKP20765.1 hypothetical protein ROZALSC1DRAFT_27775 [Rozella allomycis CSF55]|eukprot:EPZ34198.1 hypothetical protein O9G_004314 [Rozella allomycis CSF55]